MGFYFPEFFPALMRMWDDDDKYEKPFFQTIYVGSKCFWIVVTNCFTQIWVYIQFFLAHHSNTLYTTPVHFWKCIIWLWVTLETSTASSEKKYEKIPIRCSKVYTYLNLYTIKNSSGQQLDIQVFHPTKIFKVYNIYWSWFQQLLHFNVDK